MQPARSLTKPLVYGLAFALPLLMALVVAVAGLVVQNPLGPAPAFDGPLPSPPEHDSAKRTAVIVAGNVATEVSDLLGPYEVLAASDAFNVYVVAPERTLTPLVPVPAYHCCAAIDLVPHYSFAEYDRAIGVAPDLIVVPYIPLAAEGKQDAAVLAWLRERPGDQTVVLSICGGAQMVADSGILAGHTATSHHITLPVVTKDHPEVTWVTGVRYVDDGPFISSAGVTSGIDASLYTVQRFLGRDAALETAQRVGYPHTDFLDDRTWVLPPDNDAAALPNLFRFGRTRIGLFLYPGVGEIELSSVTDTYPRALATDVLSIGAERAIVRTRHGLNLVPRHDLSSVRGLDRMLVPGQADADLVAPVERWAEARNGPAVEHIHAGGDYPYDSTLTDIAHRETRLIARNAARWIEYPTAHLKLVGSDWRLALLLRPVALGLVGVIVTFGLRRYVSGRRTVQGARRNRVLA
jgi:transcriptional regulator GlxA family with amidase domain